jgi:hypothetical protein
MKKKHRAMKGNKSENGSISDFNENEMNIIDEKNSKLAI